MILVPRKHPEKDLTGRSLNIPTFFAILVKADILAIYLSLQIYLMPRKQKKIKLISVFLGTPKSSINYLLV